MELSINQNGWAVTRLEDIASRITKGGTPTTYGYSFQKSGINFIKVENISEGRVNLKSITDFIDEDAHKFQSKSQLSVNDILFSIAGTIGETCVIREEYLPANTNQALAIIKGTSTAIIPKLLQLQLEAFVAKVKIKARGGAMNNVSLEDLKNLLVYIPPVPEQYRLVTKIEELFSSLDKGIKYLKTVQGQLEIYRQAVLKWAFEGKLTNKELNGNLPTGWRKKLLSDVATRITKGGTPTTYGYFFQKSGINFIKVENIESGRVNLNSITDFISEDAHRFQAKSQLYVNDILFSIAGTIGKTVVVKEEYLPANTNQALAIIRGTSYQINSRLLQLQLDAFVAKIRLKARGGAMNNISLDDLKKLSIYIPDCSEQELLRSEIESRLSVCDKIEESISAVLQQGEALRQSILKKAFVGKLVPQDPNDEPASVLLDRIKTERVKNVSIKKAKNTQTKY